MAAILNKWILVIIIAISATVISHADDKPSVSKQKNNEIKSTIKKSKLSRNQKDKEDTLVYERITEDTLIFDDKTNDDTLIFSDDELGSPNSDNFIWIKKTDNSENSSQDINFSISQNNNSGEISVNIDNYASESLQILIYTSDGKLIFDKKSVSKNTNSENLKPGIYYVYVKSNSKASFKKILVK